MLGPRDMAPINAGGSTVPWLLSQTLSCRAAPWKVLAGLALAGPRWETQQEMAHAGVTARGLDAPIGSGAELYEVGGPPHSSHPSEAPVAVCAALRLCGKPGLGKPLRRAASRVLDTYYPPTGEAGVRARRARHDLQSVAGLLSKRHPDRWEKVRQAMRGRVGTSGLFWTAVTAWALIVPRVPWAYGWPQLRDSSAASGGPLLKRFNEWLLGVGPQGLPRRVRPYFSTLLGLQNLGSKAAGEADWAEERRVLSMPRPRSEAVAHR